MDIELEIILELKVEEVKIFFFSFHCRCTSEKFD
jgi:hypothetical protein